MAAAAALLDGRNADGSVSDFVFAVTLWGGGGVPSVIICNYEFPSHEMDSFTHRLPA